MDPFEKVVRQLLDLLELRHSEAVSQGDQRRQEFVRDIMKDMQNISDSILREQAK